MESCITQDFKTILLGAIAKKRPHEVLQMFVEDMPPCTSPAVKGAAVKEAAKRGSPEAWPPVVLHKQDGSVQAGTLSGLFKETFGLPVTEDVVCRVTREGEPDCRALSAVENWQNRGYLVRGDGEPAPVIEKEMTSGQIDKMYKDWKNSLLSQSKKINLFHPKYKSKK